MNEHRWFNQSQPQTLQFAVMLGYFTAGFGVLRGAFLYLPMLLVLIALGAGSFGIANERKWGYTTAVSGAAGHVALLLALFGFATLQELGLLITFMFSGALLLLLVHPMSRDYQRIWFK